MTPNELLDVSNVIKSIRSSAHNIEQFHKHCLTRVTKVCELLNSEQRNVFLGLLEIGYYCVDYFSEFPTFLSEYITSLGVGEVVVFPVMSNHEHRRQVPKSGTALLYASRLIIEKYNPNAVVLTNPFFAPTEYADFTYVAIDDFVGTGDSVFRTFADQHAAGHTPSKTCVVALAAMQNAIIDLNLGSIACRAANILKSVFDNPIRKMSGPDARTRYISIAELTTSPDNLRLGYRDSEALAVLMRTPDNTLGAFWHDFGPTVGNIQAIFSR